MGIYAKYILPHVIHFAGGCHLGRAIPELIRAGGFEIDTLDTLYLPGWRPAAFNYWGVASPR